MCVHVGASFFPGQIALHDPESSSIYKKKNNLFVLLKMICIDTWSDKTVYM